MPSISGIGRPRVESVATLLEYQGFVDLELD